MLWPISTTTRPDRGLVLDIGSPRRHERRTFLSLRARRSNLDGRSARGPGLLRRVAPRNDGHCLRVSVVILSRRCTRFADRAMERSPAMPYGDQSGDPVMLAL